MPNAPGENSDVNKMRQVLHPEICLYFTSWLYTMCRLALEHKHNSGPTNSSPSHLPAPEWMEELSDLLTPPDTTSEGLLSPPTVQSLLIKCCFWSNFCGGGFTPQAAPSAFQPLLAPCFGFDAPKAVFKHHSQVSDFSPPRGGLIYFMWKLNQREW